MTNEDFKDKIYEDMMLIGRLTNSTVVCDLSDRTNQYGESRQYGAMLKKTAASSIADLAYADNIVAGGIVLGLELSKPNFEKIGRDFLETKISDYKRSKLGAALTRVMFSELSYPRIDSIIKGVKDVLDNNPDLSEEAKAAVLAAEIYDNTNKFKNPKEFRDEYTYTLGFVYEGTNEKGTVCCSNPEIIKELKEKKTEKGIIIRHPDRSKELEYAYNYYINHFDEMPKCYRIGLEGEKQEDIVAYYVVSMGENKLHELYKSNIQ